MQEEISRMASSVDPDEVARFSAHAAEWWDPKGKFAPLHRLNPLRLDFIRTRVCTPFGRDAKSLSPFGSLSLLDIGCGGGLLAEPMARLGFAVTGVDASARNVKTAAAHAAEQGLAIDYRQGSAEALAETGARFDVVLNMEVVEHVADVQSFLQACGKLVKPGGLMIVATINRTPKAFALAIVGAEYLLGWLPCGTHAYDKLRRPEELEAALKAGGLSVRETTGVAYNILRDQWRLVADLSVNYMMLAEKA
jgi:2-polyprenyl-6-hydroxyphenyl methylase / 3-demethylubiquinone-9 3-methyltransferase